MTIEITYTVCEREREFGAASATSPAVRIRTNGAASGVPHHRHMGRLVYELAARIEACTPRGAAWVVVPDVQAGMVHLEMCTIDCREDAFCVLREAVES